MKKKIKLRDLTEEQYKKWYENECGSVVECNNCPLEKVICLARSKDSWIKNKDLYSDKFLDQEIEIEIPELLTKEEKEYLENLLRPFKDKVEHIEKEFSSIDGQFISFKLKFGYYYSLPYFKTNKYYKNMKEGVEYTLEELGLFEESKYKITLTEFWNSEDKLAIHCDTRKKADKFIEKSNKTDKWGDFGNCYGVYKEKTCYCNEARFDELEYCRENNYTIYEFEDVDLEN